VQKIALITCAMACYRQKRLTTIQLLTIVRILFLFLISQCVKCLDSDSSDFRIESAQIPPEVYSCEGKCDFYTGACHCDENCLGYGDCCDDICTSCPETDQCVHQQDSCSMNCGIRFENRCSCDVDCHQRNDCCKDLCDFCDCAFINFVTQLPTISCDGHCGKLNIDGACDCDSNCVEKGSCCEDFCSYCPGEGKCFMELIDKSSSDQFLCLEEGCETTITSVCNCDNDCFEKGDCCEDFCEVCGMCEKNSSSSSDIHDFQKETNVKSSAEVTSSHKVSSNSCKEKCGFYTGSCFCDSECLNHGDCCEDFCTHCSANIDTCLVQNYDMVRAKESCNFDNCGYELEECSCTLQCLENGNCCNDFCEMCLGPQYCSEDFQGNEFVLKEESLTTEEQKEEIDPVFSCQNKCEYFTGKCYCDDKCVENGDCCSDSCAWCGHCLLAEAKPEESDAQPGVKVSEGIDDDNFQEQLCQSDCGTIRPSNQCQCDYDCIIYGDCCADFCSACIDCSEEPFKTIIKKIEEESTCQSNCGKLKEGGLCQCDEYCVVLGDCCDDACSECGLCPLPPLHDDEGEEAFSLPADYPGYDFCKDQGCANGQDKYLTSCFCDPPCLYFGDCCSDACEECGVCEATVFTPKPIPCKDKFCHPINEYCCNKSCGTCAPKGESCQKSTCP